MNATRRIVKIQNHRRLNRHKNLLRHKTLAFPKIRAKLLEMAATIVNLSLVTQRKPLEDVVPNRFVRWLLRRIYEHYGFAARDTDGRTYFNIEYRGVFSDPAFARYLASCPGGSVRTIPLNAGLPEETVQYGTEDVPLSEASADYRRGMVLPFVAVSRDEMERLDASLRRTDSFVAEYRAKSA